MRDLPSLKATIVCTGDRTRTCTCNAPNILNVRRLPIPSHRHYIIHLSRHRDSNHKYVYSNLGVCMSKFQVSCSCINCKTTTTTKCLKRHYEKCVGKNVCQHCGDRTNNPTYCSHSCSAKANNQDRIKPAPIPVDKFAQTLERFKIGSIVSRPTLRTCLAHTHGYKCNVCQLDDWNNLPITLIVDHINGDASNNHPTNLRLICPNCNSQTSTFSGRNKGNGRKSRGLPLN